MTEPTIPTQTAGISVDAFRDRVRATESSCKLCSYRGHSIAKHLREAHRVSTGQYQKQFPKETHPNVRICSPIVAELLRRLDRKEKVSGATLETFLPPFVASDDIDNTFLKVSAHLPQHQVGTTSSALIPEKDDDFKFDEVATKATLAGLSLGKNIYLSGPTGCGKTELILQTFARLKRPIHRANMHGDMTVAKFIGSKQANAQGTYFKYGLLPTALKEGSVILLDEVDYTPPHIAAVMNAVLERGHTMYLEDTDETITAKPGFMIIASGNTGGKGDANGVYSGTEILNTAFLDRFAVKITLDYLSLEDEVAMLTKRFPSEQAAEIRLMSRCAQEVRTAFKQGNLSVTLSTRKLRDLFELKPILGREEALKAVLMGWLDGDDTTIVREIFKRLNVKV